MVANSDAKGDCVWRKSQTVKCLLGFCSPVDQKAHVVRSGAIAWAPDPSTSIFSAAKLPSPKAEGVSRRKKCGPHTLCGNLLEDVVLQVASANWRFAADRRPQAQAPQITFYSWGLEGHAPKTECTLRYSVEAWAGATLLSLGGPKTNLGLSRSSGPVLDATRTSSLPRHSKRIQHLLRSCHGLRSRARPGSSGCLFPRCPAIHFAVPVHEDGHPRRRLAFLEVTPQSDQ